MRREEGIISLGQLDYSDMKTLWLGYEARQGRDSKNVKVRLSYGVVTTLWCKSFVVDEHEHERCLFEGGRIDLCTRDVAAQLPDAAGRRSYSTFPRSRHPWSR